MKEEDYVYYIPYKGCHNSAITKCCKNILKTSGNFKWKYKI